MNILSAGYLVWDLSHLQGTDKFRPIVSFFERSGNG